jgi:hypothetical protein
MAPMPGFLSSENAEILALQGLGWLAGDTQGLQAFLNHSGLDPADLRQAAGSPEMAVAVLDFLLGHEELLLGFCQSADIAPKELQLARLSLGGAI